MVPLAPYIRDVSMSYTVNHGDILETCFFDEHLRMSSLHDDTPNKIKDLATTGSNNLYQDRKMQAVCCWFFVSSDSKYEMECDTFIGLADVG